MGAGASSQARSKSPSSPGSAAASQPLDHAAQVVPCEAPSGPQPVAEPPTKSQEAGSSEALVLASLGTFQKTFRRECAKIQAQIDKRVEVAFQEQFEERQRDGQSLSEEEEAALHKTIKETDAKSHPSWTAQDALSEILAEILTKALVKGFTPDGGCPENMDLAFVRALAHETPESIYTQLQNQQTMWSLAKRIHEESIKMAAATAPTGADLNDKFMVSAEKGFTMNFGSMVDFSKGLEKRIGSPNPNLLPSMIREHCDSCDSNRQWTTGNYGVTTSSSQEFLLVVQEVVQQCKKDQFGRFPAEWRAMAADLEAGKAPLPPRKTWPTEWPKETKNAEKGRHPEEQKFLEELLKKNTGLKKLGQKILTLEEGIMLRLYTGPLFEKYNVVPRGGALDGCDNVFLERRFQELCCEFLDGKAIENRYATSIHVLSSGVVKLSKLSKAAKVYRGLGGNLLPREFWQCDEFDCKGGVEFGFMSTTRDPNVAAQYAGDGEVRMVLEIETGSVDRGADLQSLSQYPHEAELLFPPLTCLQVLATKSERGVLMVKTRANINLKNGTIDEVISKRHQVLTTMVEANSLEADQLLRSTTWRSILVGWERSNSWVDDQLLKDFRGVLDRKMKAVMSEKATAYNVDSTFLVAVHDLVQILASCRLQTSSFLREVAAESKHERLLELADSREAMEVKKQTVSFSFKADAPGTGSLWLFDVLGFEKAPNGLYYKSKDRTQYREGLFNCMRDVATKGVEFPGSDWALVAINGCRDIQLQARTLQSHWRGGTKMEMALQLCQPMTRQDFALALREALQQRVDIGPLTQRLLSNHRCEDLDLNKAGLDDDQGAQFMKALALAGCYLNNLELLMLGENNLFKTKTATGLAEALSAGGFPKLRHLRLGGCPCLFAETDGETMQTFCLSLAQCRALEELDLSSTGLTSSAGAGAALATALPRWTKLRKLELWNNPKLFENDHAGSDAVSRAVGSLGNLEELGLSHTGLASCGALAEALPKCAKLRKLELDENEQLEEVDKQRIRKAVAARKRGGEGGGGGEALEYFEI